MAENSIGPSIHNEYLSKNINFQPNFLFILGSGSSSISSNSSASAPSNPGPPVAAVAGAPRNVRDALNMLHQNKTDTSTTGAYVANHYHASGRANDSDAMNGTNGSISANKKYSGAGNNSEYNQAITSNK